MSPSLTPIRWPVEWRREQWAYRELLVGRHPDLARVPWAATGVPLHGARPWLWVRRQVEHLRWRVMPRVTRGRMRPHDYRQYAHYGAWIRSGSRAFFESVLGDREIVGAVFQPAAVARLLRSHLEGRVDAYQELSALASVVLWLRFFARGDTLAPAEDAAAAPSVSRS